MEWLELVWVGILRQYYALKVTLFLALLSDKQPNSSVSFILVML